MTIIMENSVILYLIRFNELTQIWVWQIFGRPGRLSLLSPSSPGISILSTLKSNQLSSPLSISISAKHAYASTCSLIQRVLFLYEELHMSPSKSLSAKTEQEERNSNVETRFCFVQYVGSDFRRAPRWSGDLEAVVWL